MWSSCSKRHIYWISTYPDGILVMLAILMSQHRAYALPIKHQAFTMRLTS